jgi:hypothetical protein
VPGIGITFEAASFGPAFERSLVIAEDLAHYDWTFPRVGVVLVEAFETIAETILDLD